MRRAVATALVVLAVAGAGVGTYFALRRPRLPPAPTEAELDALRKKREAIQQRIVELTVQKDDQGLSRAPRAGVMIGVPTALTRSIASQIVTGLLGETTLTLRNIKVHHQGDVKARMLLRKKRIGEFVVDVDIHEVKGLLKPGAPELAFGQDRIAITLPVRVADGGGTAAIRFRWDSKGALANVVCGDLDARREVSGSVVPSDYRLEGRFLLSSEGNTIVLRPDFDEIAFRLQLEASKESWATVDALLEEQAAVCKMALDKIDVKAKLAAILARGFNVKLRKKLFHPIRLPAGVESSLELQGVVIGLRVVPTGLAVTPDRLWYGADVDARARR